MKKRKLVVLLGAIALVSACSSTVSTLKTEGYAQMSGSEIRTAIVGNTLSGTDSDGDYMIYYPNSSQMRIAYQGREESGAWRIQGDRYCRRWETFGSGKERCVTMFRKGDRLDWVQNGKITDRSVLLKGNSNGF
tara:strand:- start:726 stop:1127 length:402 start_codon:yes stop_codon:yes gene_type:complete